MVSADPKQEPVTGDQIAAAEPIDTGANKIIPTGQVVILREAELDCDLGTAIERVRAQGETSQSRILIIASDEEKAAPTGSPALPEPTLPTSVLQAVRAGGEQALFEAGERCRPLLQSLERFFEETRWVLDEIDEAAEEGIRARLKSRVRVAQDILGWIQCVVDEMGVQVDAASQGLRTVDMLQLMQESQGHIESFFPGVRVTVAAAPEAMTCRGRATELSEACFLALLLTSHRIGGQGAVTVEPARASEHVQFRVVGLGEPQPVQAPETMERLREIVVTRHGGCIQPDALGPFGTGLLLQLPI